MIKVHNLRDYQEYFSFGNKYMKCMKCTVDITQGLFFRKTKTVTVFKNWADTWRYLDTGLEVDRDIDQQLGVMLKATDAKDVLDNAMQSQ